MRDKHHAGRLSVGSRDAYGIHESCQQEIGPPVFLRMKITSLKKFSFSASYGEKGRVIGHNYALGVLTDALDEAQEKMLERVVQRSLIQRIDSRDLTLDVDFLKDTEITDINLLHTFWKLLEPSLRPILLRALFLEKDGRSQVRLDLD